MSTATRTRAGRRGPIGRALTAAVVIAAGSAPLPSPATLSPVSPAVTLTADSTALILCGGTCPTPDAAYIEAVRNHFIAPTHPDQNIDYVPVTTPDELWPLTGLTRLLGLALGPPSLFGLDGPAWPDEPWWKLSGFFDLTADQSLRAGVADLEAAMVAHGNDHLVIYGLSQGANVANAVKKRLAEEYPAETPAGADAPDIDFVLGGDLNLPNGGMMSRFPGIHIPILDWTFDGPEPTDTRFDTTVITRQYDAFADFPLYPLNLVADLNAFLGIFYVHMYSLEVSLPADPTASPLYQGTHGDTSYYFFPTPELPLFAPLRRMGVPEKLIDVVEPVFRVLVELGYDRSIPAWQPTTARLIPKHDPEQVGADLAGAIGEGIDNARALFGLPALPRDSAPVQRAAQTVKDPARQVGTPPSTGAPATERAKQGGRVGSVAREEPSHPPHQRHQGSGDRAADGRSARAAAGVRARS